MFKDVQCEHRCSHGTHQADSPILAKRVPALHCRWLQQLPLFRLSVHPRLLEGEAHTPVLSQTPTKRNCRVWDLERAWECDHLAQTSNPSIWQCCVQKLSKPEASARWRPILLENEVVRLPHSSNPLTTFQACRGTSHHWLLLLQRRMVRRQLSWT